MTETARKAILIANPRSGRSRKWTFRVVERCSDHGIHLVSTHFEISPAGIDEALDNAERAGIDIVLVSGGDGTVGSVAGALVGRTFTLGVLPAGTSNDFARSLQLPLDPDSALRVIAGGHTACVDLGSVGGSVFCHAATVGLNTDFANAAQRLRPYLRRFSYPVAATLVYLRRRRFHFLVQSGDRSEESEALEIALINAPVYGGRLDLEVPGSRVTDGQIQMIVVKDVSLAFFLRAIPILWKRQPLRLPGVVLDPLKEAWVSTTPAMRFTVDGEVGGSTPADVKILPASLRVFVPPSFGER